jgi:hypothetical protein
MKTINDINKEIQTLIKEIETGTKAQIPKSKLQKLADGIARLKIVRTYLESNPSEAYLIKERDRISKLLTALEERFIKLCQQQWKGQEIPQSMKSKMRGEHNKQYDISRLKAQLKTVEYLLEGK